jgi:hypothetical protein
MASYPLFPVVVLVVGALTVGCAASTQPTAPEEKSSSVRSVRSHLELQASLPDDATIITSVDITDGDGLCKATVGAYSDSTPNHVVYYFQRADVGGCQQTLGYASLGESTSAWAFAAAGRWDDQGTYIAVAFTENGNLRLRQIDPVAGDTLQDAVLAVEGSDGDGSSLTPTGLSLNGNDVILTGTGVFPGAAGDGPGFSAQYTGLLAGGSLHADPAATTQQ